MLRRLMALLAMLVLCTALPVRAAAQQQCAQPRNLCADPQMCFMTQKAQDDWADAHNCTFITMQMLEAADPDGSSATHEAVLGYLNKFAREYAVNTPARMAHFLSQIGHESGFQATTESLSYSAKRMHQIFGCKGGPKNYSAAQDDCTKGRLRDKLWTQQSDYEHNAENLGNYVYANRNGNGDEASGDGYKYRGRGLIQLTGRTNYQGFQDRHNALNPDDQQSFIDHPELVADNTEYAVESAFYFWDAHGINATADTGTVKDVTEAVNGGTNGYDDRKKRYNAVACLLGATQET
ncbi:putative chitinase [Fulvimonas soli]|uniref:Putative chitinase n=2 Tax=Fulvimonas soli TaxID=155197 RepID=A0A316IHM5_9GAMM|nr:putative chitinase [Fulvimonas soli]